MKLLNVGCGSNRPQDEHWWNLDNLRTQLKEGTPERINLERELRYMECDLSTQSIPTVDEAFDAVLLSHVIEHFDCHGAVEVILKCRRVLKPGGILVVSVPDASYFLSVHDKDVPERAVELFGEPICPAEQWHKSFFDYALFLDQHRQVLTRDSLICLLIRAGFDRKIMAPRRGTIPAYREIEKIMNRRKFSLEMCAIK